MCDRKQEWGQERRLMEKQINRKIKMLASVCVCVRDKSRVDQKAELCVRVRDDPQV